MSKACAIVLAGGASSRLGRDKAFVEVEGQTLIARVVTRLRTVVDEVLIVANDPPRFAALGAPVFGDVYRGIGALGGLHAALSALETTHHEYGLVVGCDMPLLNPDLLRYMLSLRSQRAQFDVVMPRIGEYYEPLHALYSRRCLPTVEQHIRDGERRILRALADLNIRYLTPAEIARYDPQHLSFFNVNTPQDLERARSLLEKRRTPGGVRR